jgi:predicted RNase H-like HicB family nuclease
MAHLTYTILLEPDPDAGGYTVTVPELPGCVTQAESVQEALAMARDAITLHVEGLAADGLPVPIERAAPQLATVDIEIDDAIASRVA